jgi:membrane-associated phospholipid phosphatase
VQRKIFRYIGFIGTIICAGIFIRNPSWPTPDKIIFFLTFIFMSFGKAAEMLKRLLPFVVLLAVYESFRGIADKLNTHVNYTFMPNFDKWLFAGHIPTIMLQQWWWRGSVSWYDFIFYLVYMMHFIFPIVMALLVWKFKDSEYWRVVSTYVVLSFMGFLTYLAFPAAPPWLASDHHVIPPITHISGWVFGALGLKDFPSLYSKITPNAVAAVPSLHAAYSTLFVIFVFTLFGKKWGALSLIYPIILITGTIYTGEHYIFDVILGIVYTFIAFFFTQWFFRSIAPKLKKRYNKRFKKPALKTA